MCVFNLLIISAIWSWFVHVCSLTMYENESTFVLDFYTKDMRLYSIIIPVYNRPDELDDLLSSLCKQTYVHFEVIVVEDGSEIPAKEIVGRYQGRMSLLN